MYAPDTRMTWKNLGRKKSQRVAKYETSNWPLCHHGIITMDHTPIIHLHVL